MKIHQLKSLNQEDIYQFIYDIEQDRKREIAMEDAVLRMGMENSYLNLN